MLVSEGDVGGSRAEVPSASSPPQAGESAVSDDGDGHPDENSRLLDVLRDQICQGLAANLPGRKANPLSIFEWNPRNADDQKHRAEVVLDVVKVGGGTFDAALVIKSTLPDSDVIEHRVPLHCYFSHSGSGTAKDLLQFYVAFPQHGLKNATWNLASPEVVQAWRARGESQDIEGVLGEVSDYQKPNESPGIENLAAVWFEEKDDSEEEIAPGVEKVRAPAEGDLDRYWPRHDDGRWSARLPRVTVTEGLEIQTDAVSWVACLLCFVVWAFITRVYRAELTDEGAVEEWGSRVPGLPRAKAYEPRRYVNLRPEAVRAYIERHERLRVPWHVLESACAAANAGKHVIFTGPPGCGKTKLAKALAWCATEREPLLVTGSPAWTSGDLVGRYFPKPDGAGLVFKPGFFLQAMEERRWLLIDEFNRCDIDQCFGEMFSVVAGDTARLPFEAEAEEEPGMKPVRVVPWQRGQNEAVDAGGGVFRDYIMMPSFRILGTMNDSDRSRLHQLSFALQRRFVLVRVEAPDHVLVRQVIDERIADQTKELGLDKHCYTFGTKHLNNTAGFHHIRDVLHRLFADPSANLVSLRVVGLATVKDVIEFTAEGLRAPESFKTVSSELGSGKDAARALASSYLAMALVLSVFPQLEALTDGDLRAAVTCLMRAFAEKGEPIPFVKLDRKEEGHSLIKQRTIVEFFHDELARQFTGREDTRQMLDEVRDSLLNSSENDAG